MKKSLRSRISTKANRLRRHSGHISREVFGALLLITMVFLITATLIYGYNVVLSSSTFWIKQTVVKGCKEVTEKDVLTLAAVKSSQSILSLNVGTMAKRIKANPWIKEVSIGREFPDRLVIEIQEKRPVAVLKKDQGFFLMDSEGVAIKNVETADEADLPILTGYNGEGKENVLLMKHTLGLLQLLAASKTFPSLANVSEIHGNEVLGVSIYTDRGFCLNLGFDAYEIKLNRLGAVMADLERKNLNKDYSNIDLSDPSKITVQRRHVSVGADHSGSKKGYRI